MSSADSPPCGVARPRGWRFVCETARFGSTHVAVYSRRGRSAILHLVSPPRRVSSLPAAARTRSASGDGPRRSKQAHATALASAAPCGPGAIYGDTCITNQGISPIRIPAIFAFSGPGSAEGNTSALRAFLSPLRGSVYKARITGGLRPRPNPFRPLGAKRRVLPRAGPF